MPEYRYKPKYKPLPMPNPDQPVRVLLQYTGCQVIERWITMPNLQAYFDRLVIRYRPFQDPSILSRRHRRFRIAEVTWEGKPPSRW